MYIIILRKSQNTAQTCIYLAWFCCYDIYQCSISLHAKWKLQDLKRPQTLSSPSLYSPGPLAKVSMSSHYVELLRLDQIWFQIGQLCMAKASSYWPYLVESVSVQLGQPVLKYFCCLVEGGAQDWGYLSPKGCPLTCSHSHQRHQVGKPHH